MAGDWGLEAQEHCGLGVAAVGAGDWGLVAGGSGARAWLVGGLRLGWLVIVIGDWRCSWLTGWLSREAWFSVRELDQMVNGPLFRDW